MKAGLWLAAAVSLGAALASHWTPPQGGSAQEWTLLVGGSSEGYLSPCGCVKPMSGGIRRRATSYRQAAAKGPTLALELGPLSGGLSRQHEIKVETLAQALESAGVDAISLSRQDARLGPGVAASLARLSGNKLISTGLPGALEGEVAEFHEKGPFLVGSWDPQSQAMARELGGEARTAREALSALAEEADQKGLTSVLMLEGTLAEATSAAQMEPRLGLILYRSDSNPPLTLQRRGRTFLATPGPKGKAHLKIKFSKGSFTGLEVVDLGPSLPDDPKVQALFREYQQRVEEEKLLEMTPRVLTEDFAGSRTCISCHASEGKIWAESRHAKALKTLEDDGHGRDPDCVSCHVVHLESEKGFRTREATPDLANVGCESCHGPGALHSMQPYKHKMPAAGSKSCQSCHVPDHSPGFDFEKDWAKIAH